MTGDSAASPLTPTAGRPGGGRPKRRGWWQLNGIGVTIAVLGLIITGSLSWTARRLDDNSERQLLRVQTKQAATVVAAAITGVEAPLQTALDVAFATDGDAARFKQFMATYVASGGLFVSASLWPAQGAAPIATIGAPLTQPSMTAAVRALVARSLRSSTFVVSSLSNGAAAGIGYALASPKAPGYVIYAERAIPVNRRVPVESSSAFADLHFATYLGPATTMSAMQTTDVGLDRLPLTGVTARESIPFGDTTLTLVTSRARHLGGALGGELPWILLIAGLALTGAATLVGVALTRQRGRAEADARTISSLYDEVDGLYQEQRTIAETLQHALIPRTNPSIPSVELASRYVAGTRGVDIGGDWFSTARLDEDHFAFVVGDVSGRGVDAAALMARIRFTLSAYLVEGHPPGIALQMCAAQVDLRRDGHFATALIGVADLTSRDVVLANAGHLCPLLVAEGRADYVDTAVGVPLGVTAAGDRTPPYPTTRLTMPPGSMLLAFTDGLVERRTEDIDQGLRRLADAAATTDQPLEDVLTHLLDVMVDNGADDDVAMLAFRWTADGGAAQTR